MKLVCDECGKVVIIKSKTVCNPRCPDCGCGDFNGSTGEEGPSAEDIAESRAAAREEYMAHGDD